MDDKFEIFINAVMAIENEVALCVAEFRYSELICFGKHSMADFAIFH